MLKSEIVALEMAARRAEEERLASSQTSNGRQASPRTSS